jgi:DNA-binding NtrC family response regulator
MTAWRPSPALSTAPPPLPTSPPPVEVPRGGWHGALRCFKRALLEHTLAQTSGNRTHAARALGLQRTYLLRLLRELDMHAVPPARRPTPAPSGRPATSQGR